MATRKLKCMEGLAVDPADVHGDERSDSTVKAVRNVMTSIGDDMSPIAAQHVEKLIATETVRGGVRKLSERLYNGRRVFVDRPGYNREPALPTAGAPEVSCVQVHPGYCPADHSEEATRVRINLIARFLHMLHGPFVSGSGDKEPLITIVSETQPRNTAIGVWLYCCSRQKHPASMFVRCKLVEGSADDDNMDGKNIEISSSLGRPVDESLTSWQLAVHMATSLEWRVRVVSYRFLTDEELATIGVARHRACAFMYGLAVGAEYMLSSDETISEILKADARTKKAAKARDKLGSVNSSLVDLASLAEFAATRQTKTRAREDQLVGEEEPRCRLDGESGTGALAGQIGATQCDKKGKPGADDVASTTAGSRTIQGSVQSDDNNDESWHDDDASSRSSLGGSGGDDLKDFRNSDPRHDIDAVCGQGEHVGDHAADMASAQAVRHLLPCRSSRHRLPCRVDVLPMHVGNSPFGRIAICTVTRGYCPLSAF